MGPFIVRRADQNTATMIKANRISQEGRNQRTLPGVEHSQNGDDGTRGRSCNHLGLTERLDECHGDLLPPFGSQGSRLQSLCSLENIDESHRRCRRSGTRRWNRERLMADQVLQVLQSVLERCVHFPGDPCW